VDKLLQVEVITHQVVLAAQVEQMELQEVLEPLVDLVVYMEVVPVADTVVV
tara:strand:- start:53 stop:205 length:153 start_codon:yes stop_codon:yes gene_type:complete